MFLSSNPGSLYGDWCNANDPSHRGKVCIDKTNRTGRKAEELRASYTAMSHTST